MILFVVNSIVGRSGNYGNRVLPIISELARRGSEYFVFARGVKSEDVKEKQSLLFISHYSRVLNAIRLYFFPKWNHRHLDIKIFQFFAEVYFWFKPSLVSKTTIVHLFEPSPRLIKFFQKRQVKVVLDLPIVPSSYVLKNINNLPLYPYDLTKFEDSSIMMSDIIVCPSEFVYNYLEELNVENKVIIPFGVFQPNKFKTDFKMGVKFKVGFLGQASLRKGVKDLYVVMKRLRNNVNCELHLFGKLSPDVEKLLISYTNLEIVKHGFIDINNPLLVEMDVMVMPSFMEGCSKAAMECCALGIPLVVSYESGPVTKNKVSAMHFNAGDIDMLERLLTELYHNENLRMNLGNNARKEMKNWTWNKYSRSLTKLYDNLYN